MGVFERWMRGHPNATLEDAFTGGYIAGAQDMRQTLWRQQQAQGEGPRDAQADPQAKIARTIIAALGYFADQILRGAPQEVQSGEWCSVEEVHALIHQLTTTGEVAHHG